MTRPEKYWRAGHYVKRPSRRAARAPIPVWVIGVAAVAVLLFGGVKISSGGSDPAPAPKPTTTAAPSASHL